MIVVEITNGELDRRLSDKLTKFGHYDSWLVDRCFVMSLVDAVEDACGIRLSVPISCTMGGLAYGGERVLVEKRGLNNTHAVLIRGVK